VLEGVACSQHAAGLRVLNITPRLPVVNSSSSEPLAPMPQQLSPPISFQLTPAQLAWLDARRHHGSLSRSAALRQALDTLIQIQAAQPDQAPSRRRR
jgi:hypothetical protein